MIKKKQPLTFKKQIRNFWKVFLGGTSLVFIYFLCTSMGLLGALPTFEELENPQINIATEIISIDGKTIGKFATENRTPIQFKDLPNNLVNALVATEDERFYEHSGIDFRSLARAVIKMGSGGGGSTVTQQLAKLLFTGKPSRNPILRIHQKMKEWIVAIKLERQYTKNELVAMYFNKQGFLFNASGIRSAARIYFGKEAHELDIQECAIIVAMLKNPRQFNPHRERSKNKSLQRRNVVFAQMTKSNFITEKEKDSLQKLPLKINFTPESHSDGQATYFRTQLQKYMRKWVKNNPKPNGEKYNIYKDGLKIYVTLDSRMQKYAEESVTEHVSNLQNYFSTEQLNNKTAPFYDLEEEQIEEIYDRAKRNSDRYRRLKSANKSAEYIDSVFNKKTEMSVFSWKGDIDTIMSPNDSIKYYKHFLRAGLLSIEPQTGHVKAWVGGINNKHFQYDAVEQQKRQVGSTFKPFVYATAINQLRLSPCDSFPNTPYTIPKGKYGLGEPWTPGGSEGKYGGMISLKDALARSMNEMSARMIDKASPINVVRFAKSSGIESRIPVNPSIALGTVDLSLMEMVSAYSTYANKGLRVKPMMVTRIEDKNGTVLEEFIPETKEVLSEESAYVIVDLLKGVTNYGSGVRLRTTYDRPEYLTGYPYGFDNSIAGKTGTSQNHSDGWFMGIVPNLATGVWTGGEDRATHFFGIGMGQGASMSLPTWALFMQKCYADETLNISKEDFEKPSKLSINIDCGKDLFKTDTVTVVKPPKIAKDDIDF